MKKLSIENKIENLDKVAEFVEKFGEENKLDGKTVFEINLILDELVTNIVSYAYDDNDIHMIDILLEQNNGIINIQTIDDGKEFNPLEKEEVKLDMSLDERKIGGLGIHIVKQKTDEISYERKENKNVLYLTKSLNANGDKNGN